MKIGEYELDNDQMNIVKCDDKYILVVAGAGSGKTLTILGKIKYLVENGYKEDEILCISFTKTSSMELENKIKKNLNYNIDVYTFHKLAINCLNQNKIKKKICCNELLDIIIHNYIYIDVLKYKIQKKYILKLVGKKVFFIKNYSKYISMINTKVLERNIATFIRLLKCNGYDINYIYMLLNKKNNRLYKYFLLITLNCLLLYEKELEDNNEYDFDDLIINSYKYLNNRYKKYKYIIIDEYQDTSLIRFRLIKKIIEYNNAKLMVVGDDFQSIYRFTGCNIDLFTNFRNYFEGAKIMYISNTYRNSQELVNIAGKFVMKNKYQIKKNLRSNKHLDKPIIIVYYKDIVKSLEEIINNLEGNILIIGRNNNDVKMIISKSFRYDGNYIYYKDRKISYLTVHKSKGLESDNVIIINNIDDILGFPSKLREDKTLKDLVNEENFLYGEERRLFYVALTRTKNKVYLLAPYKNRSCFIKELEKDKNILKIKM